MNRDIIVIGASMGGIEAMHELLKALPSDLPAAIFIVQRIGSQGLGILPDLLNQVSALPVQNARNWEPFKPGHVYIAPPDYHLLLDKAGYTRISRGPRENRTRPAIDPLFRSAAFAFGARVIGVVLTGFLDDGTAGLWAVKDQGGISVVQDPNDAVAAPMPQSALRHVQVDHCVPLRDLGPLLVQLTQSATPTDEPPAEPKNMRTEVQIAQEDHALESRVKALGTPSMFACPECHGVLLQMKEGSSLRFRCHTGHAYSLETLLAEMKEATEDALWNAVRCIQEEAMLLNQMADQLAEHHHLMQAEVLRKRAREIHEKGDLVRQAAMSQPNAVADAQAPLEPEASGGNRNQDPPET